MFKKTSPQLSIFDPNMIVPGIFVNAGKKVPSYRRLNSTQ